MTDLNGPSALVVAHPGHELRVFGWAARARPIVFVLTDGSGRFGRSRLESTTRNLEEIGGKPGCIYGRHTDMELYKSIIEQDFEFFLSLTKELARSLVDQQVQCVVGDAMEGYSPSHDVCRVILNAAVAIATRAAGQRIGNFDFVLDGPPDLIEKSSRNQAVCVRLDSDAFSRKLAAARRYRELASDVNESLNRWGEEAFQVEYLRAVVNDNECEFRQPPFYEEYGEKQVKRGYYDTVLRYSEHFAPVAMAIRRLGEGAL